jgi:hypothetical protein
MADRESTPNVTTIQLAWAAGFLEGEGSFGCHGGTPRVSAGQVQREPIDRLTQMFGGHVWERAPIGMGTKPCWIWALNKQKSAGVMMTLYSFMSPKRQEEIRNALAMWRAARSLQPHNSPVCPRGHAITGHNAQKVPSRTYPRCRACHNMLKRERRKRAKANAQEAPR